MSDSIKLAVFTTHPIQYQVPWFRALENHPACESKVYFGCKPDAESQGAGFGLSFEWDTPLLDGYEWEVLENYRAKPGISGFYGSAAKNIRQVLKRDKPDVILITGWHGLVLLQALAWGRALGIPCIVRGESSGLKPRKPWIRILHRLLLANYQAFLVIGQANRQFYKKYNIADSKLFECPYFVDNKFFMGRSDQLMTDRGGLRFRWDIAEKSFCFLYVGKLNQKKRILDQMQALKIAMKTNPAICLLVAGDGELMAEARKMAQRESLPVIFAGFLNQSEVSNAYVAADCLVLSSDYDETWGLVVNEAMASGLPAIVSDRAGCNLDLIREGETGSAYTFGDCELLAKHMLDMAGNLDRARAMGMNALKLVKSEYKLERATESVIEACQYAIAKSVNLP